MQKLPDTGMRRSRRRRRRRRKGERYT